MKLSRKVLAYVAAVLGCFTALAAENGLPPEMSDLVPVKAKEVSAAYLLPGADFRAYAKVMIDPAEVAFHKNWMRDMNSSRGGASRINEGDAEEIAQAARSNFADVWEEAFRNAGYEIVKAPGTDVLRLSPGIANLYITAPEALNRSGRSRTYTVDAGEATLVLQARDSETGAILGLALDRRRAGMSGATMNWTTSVSNQADFRRLFQRWADVSAKALQDLKTNSPAPIKEAEAKTDQSR